MTRSTITRERLEKIKSWRETYGAGSNVMLPAEEAEELARMALAAMDSEPVVYTDERNLGYIDRGRETAYLWGKQNSEASDVALYRHAQQPVVPDEKDKTVDADDHPLLWSFNEGWNACRAAMLAAAPQSPGSEPATVPGKWIPVSERMPEDEEQYYLTYSEGDGVCRSYFFDGYFADQYITHWMPLPAAPQEVSDA